MVEDSISTVFTTALANFDTELLTVAAGALGVGLIVLGLTRGWGLVKRFTK